MFQATSWTALAGGMLIGLAASILLLVSGRVAGISGMIGGLVLPQRGDVAWRGLFLAGLVGAGVVAAYVVPESIGASSRSVGMLAVAGLLVGAGTRLANGCTSGHGVCGISRLSRRSLTATVMFIATGMATVALFRLLGVQP